MGYMLRSFKIHVFSVQKTPSRMHSALQRLSAEIFSFLLSKLSNMVHFFSNGPVEFFSTAKHHVITATFTLLFRKFGLATRLPLSTGIQQISLWVNWMSFKVLVCSSAHRNIQNNIWSNIWVLCGLVKLTHIINLHIIIK